MNESKISVRYAKALFDLALEKNILEEVKKDVEMLGQVCEIPEFKDFLKSPIISISDKQEIFLNIFQKNVNPYVSEFLRLLTKERRETFLKIITLNFLTLYRKTLGIKEVELTTCTEISEQTRAKIVQMLTISLKSRIDIKHKVDENIIGGFVLRVDDQQMDASVKTQLKNMRNQLVN